MRVNREWCQRSPCCAAHTIFDGRETNLPGGGHAPLPWTFHKVVIMRSLLKSGARMGSASVVFIDSDAFFVNASWIPDFTTASPGVHVGAILTPDPPWPWWDAAVNTGFLAVSRSANGVAFLDAWWREIESNSLPFWAGGFTVGLSSFSQNLFPHVHDVLCVLWNSFSGIVHPPL